MGSDALLTALYNACPGLVEFRALQNSTLTGRAFVQPGDTHGLTKFFGDHLTDNVFMGVATRKDASSGGLANCAALGALYVDIDFKITPEDDAGHRLYDFALPPSAAVCSGGGLHVYWFLREPFDLQNPADCATAHSLLRRLARHLGGDLLSAEPARILRLPGSSNYKYAPPRQVRLTHIAEELRYNPSDFDLLLPEDPHSNGEQPTAAFTVPPRIQDGERNTTLYKLARSLKARGLSRDSIQAALREENRVKCEPPLDDAEVAAIATHASAQADRPEFRSHTPVLSPADADMPTPVVFAVGLGEFLARGYPPAEAFVESILSSDGGGWIAGEEKLMKTLYAEEEALCLACGLPVCGRFAVPSRRRVLFIEEEDGPRRTQTRLSALLRGHGLNPEDDAIRQDVDAWFRLVVWSGFTFDEEPMRQRLEKEVRDFTPAVVYVDVLRKVTARDLNKAQEASSLLAILDDLRRRYNVLFRVLHHYRKSQGFRVGRGSQEIGGSYVLGAWAENSLFFEPIGRKQGAVRVEAQNKDGPPTPAFQLKIEAEGPMYAPTLLRLLAEDITDEKAAEKLKEAVFEAVATLPAIDPFEGRPGVPLKAICEAVKKSDRPVRTALTALTDDERIVVAGKATKRRALYAVREAKPTA